MKSERTASSLANMRRTKDIFKNIREKTGSSCFFDPDSIESYEKKIQRPTFGGRLTISWVKEQR